MIWPMKRNFRLSLIGFALVAASVPAVGQVSPLHVYNGVNRAFEVSVHCPSERAASLQLLKPGTAQIELERPVSRGRTDLAKIFPELWTTKSPHLLYLQLAIDGRPVGPATVLQPMTNPAISRLAADGKTVEFVPDEDQSYAGIRAYVDKDLILDTTMGRMRFRLRPDAVPNTVWNIRELVNGDFYRDIIWHRVVAKRANGTPFVIQGGDPTGTGNGGPGFAYPLEKSSLLHDFGVVSIARSTDPNTNGCQIFVCLSREGTKHLDGHYAAFGEAIEGAEAILKIAAVPVGKEDRPVNPPKIKVGKLVDAAPYGSGPKPVRRPGV